MQGLALTVAPPIIDPVPLRKFLRETSAFPFFIFPSPDIVLVSFFMPLS